MSEHRSFSQVKQLKDCGTAYKLARIDRAPKLQASWSIQGNAVHSGAEAAAWGGDPVVAYEATWEERENEALKSEPDMKKWQTGTPKRDGATDAAQRFLKGKEQLADYLAYMEQSDDEVWRLPSGEPAAEVTFELDFGGVTVKGAIDQIIRKGNGKIVVRDLKTGTKLPEDPMQLGLYAQAANRLYGLDITAGDYWMAKSGTATTEYDLSAYTEDFFAAEFANADRIIREGLFTTRPGDHCRVCDVRPSCPIRGFLKPAQQLEPFIL